MDVLRPHRFTLSWAQSLDYEIDYRDFEYCEQLPSGVPLVAIAGVWNNRGSIRCLFLDEEGNGYRRHIRGFKNKYIIPEIDVCAKEIEVGQVFIVDAEN